VVGRPVVTAVDEVTTIRVGGSSPYDVLIGSGVTQRLSTLLPGADTVAVLGAEGLESLVDRVSGAVQEAGVRVVTSTVPSGESGKRLEVASALWDELAAAGITRSDAVVSVGGGATTDVVGFAAATWLRGVRVVHVPTTLRAMVDAAIGGKTGINTSAGKNLVGAFHPPAAVVVDLDVLATLPVDEWVSGMAEVVKAGFIADPDILLLIERDPAGAASPGGPHARELIERSIRMKAQVVSADLREAGPREMLNYGHTLGHAIERAEDYAVPHGHAVAVGMMFAAALGRLAGRLDEPLVDRHRSILGQVGLPTTYSGAGWKEIRAGMQADKKTRGARLRFVVLDGIARPAILEQPDEDALRRAFDVVTA
jgi:3-dehydroquinate synthase